MHGQRRHSPSPWSTMGVFWEAVLAAFFLFGIGVGVLHLAPVVAGIPAFGLVAVTFIVIVRTQGSDGIKPGP